MKALKRFASVKHVHRRHRRRLSLHHLVYEVVDNSIDEALAKFASHIEVTIHQDESVSVVDDGRRIPRRSDGTTSTNQRSAAEIALTELHAGGKVSTTTATKISGGLHGVGVSCVNALSTWLNLTVCRDGEKRRLSFSRGRW